MTHPVPPLRSRTHSHGAPVSVCLCVNSARLPIRFVYRRRRSAFRSATPNVAPPSNRTPLQSPAIASRIPERTPPLILSTHCAPICWRVGCMSVCCAASADAGIAGDGSRTSVDPNDRHLAKNRQSASPEPHAVPRVRHVRVYGYRQMCLAVLSMSARSRARRA